MKKQIRQLVENIFDDIYDIDQENNITMEIGNKISYNYYPKNKDDLKDIIKKLLDERGPDADLNDIDVSNITDMSNLFYELDPHNIDIRFWDVSNVENMDMMFFYCNNFNCDLGYWDVSNVKTMINMFTYCQELQSNGLEKWDVRNVKNMNSMFYNCNNFNCNLGDWNIRELKDMRYMFAYCYEFEGKGLEKWKTPKVQNMNSLFRNCKEFNADLSNWNVKHVRDMSWMFNKCLKYDGKGLEKWEPNMAKWMYAMFTNCKKPSWWKKTSKPY